MPHRIIVAALGAAALAGLAGCAEPIGPYAGNPYYGHYGPGAASYRYPYYSDRHAAYATPYYRPRATYWNYETSSWDPARWDSRWSDRFRRNPDGIDRP